MTKDLTAVIVLAGSTVQGVKFSKDSRVKLDRESALQAIEQGVAMTPLDHLLQMTVETRADAELFIEALYHAGLMYHFDDGAIECLWGNNLVDHGQAETIDALVADCYAAWQASGADMRHDCPIGHALKVMGE